MEKDNIIDKINTQGIVQARGDGSLSEGWLENEIGSRD